jgi:transposase
MEDNAPIHKANSTMAWFRQKNITVMDWPPYSPDLSPIENAWGLLARKVYANGRQFATAQELKDRIIEAWSEIDQEYFNKLVKSMPKRVAEVIYRHGGSIDY